METFGCCSHYTQCSDLRMCLFVGNVDYQGCSYLKNLNVGKIFYGINASKTNIVPKNVEIITENIEIVPKNVEIITENIEIIPKNKLPEYIYISCYERYFRIGHLGGNGYSYPLSDQEKELLIEKLKALDIPYSTENDETKCIVDGDDIEPANAKVYFSFEDNGQKFSIANYNAYLIRKRYADGMAKSLLKKGIKSEVQLIGEYSKKTDYVSNKVLKIIEEKKVKDIQEVKQPENQVYKQMPKILSECEQISIFDFVS